MQIHSSALVDPEAEIGPDTVVGPWCIIEGGVVVGAGCRLRSHVVLRRGTRLAAGVDIHPGAVLGSEPQDLKFDPAVESRVEIGAGTVIREQVTVHRATQPGGVTRVGAGCYLMVASHIGHDAVAGDRVVLVNGALLAGHVEVGDDVIFGGGAMIHQFGRVGTGSMVGGGARLSKDVPPDCLVSERDRLSGLNLVGLRRRGVGREGIAQLKACFHAVYSRPGSLRAAAAAVAEEGVFTSPECARFLAFFAAGRRPVVTPAWRGTEADDGA